MFEEYFKFYEKCWEIVHSKKKETHKMERFNKVRFFLSMQIVLCIILIVCLFVVFIKNSLIASRIMFITELLEIGFTLYEFIDEKKYKGNSDMAIAEIVSDCNMLRNEMINKENSLYYIKGNEQFEFLLEKAKEKLESISKKYEGIKQKCSFILTAVLLPLFIMFLDKDFDEEKNAVNIEQFGIVVIIIGLALALIFIGIWVILENIEKKHIRKYKYFIEDMEIIIGIENGYYDITEEKTKRETQ